MRKAKPKTSYTDKLGIAPAKLWDVEYKPGDFFLNADVKKDLEERTVKAMMRGTNMIWKIPEGYDNTRYEEVKPEPPLSPEVLQEAIDLLGDTKDSSAQNSKTDEGNVERAGQIVRGLIEAGIMPKPRDFENFMKAVKIVVKALDKN